MGILSFLGLGGSSGASDIGSGIAKAADGIRSAITGELPAEVKMKLIDVCREIDIAQSKVNEIEANNKNLFISGWRPAIGWIGVLALSYTYLIYPFIVWLCNLLMISFPPDINNDILMELVFALLGVSALRTVEKFKR